MSNTAYIFFYFNIFCGRILIAHFLASDVDDQDDPDEGLREDETREKCVTRHARHLLSYIFILHILSYIIANPSLSIVRYFQSADSRCIFSTHVSTSRVYPRFARPTYSHRVKPLASSLPGTTAAATLHGEAPGTFKGVLSRSVLCALCA